MQQAKPQVAPKSPSVQSKTSKQSPPIDTSALRKTQGFDAQRALVAPPPDAKHEAGKAAGLSAVHATATVGSALASGMLLGASSVTGTAGAAADIAGYALHKTADLQNGAGDVLSAGGSALDRDADRRFHGGFWNHVLGAGEWLAGKTADVAGGAMHALGGGTKAVGDVAASTGEIVGDVATIEDKEAKFLAGEAYANLQQTFHDEDQMVYNGLAAAHGRRGKAVDDTPVTSQHDKAVAGELMTGVVSVASAVTDIKEASKIKSLPAAGKALYGQLGDVKDMAVDAGHMLGIGTDERKKATPGPASARPTLPAAQAARAGVAKTLQPQVKPPAAKMPVSVPTPKKAAPQNQPPPAKKSTGARDLALKPQQPLGNKVAPKPSAGKQAAPAKSRDKATAGPPAPAADKKPPVLTTRLGFVAQLVAENPLQYALFMSHKAGKGLDAAFTRPTDAITRAEAAEFVVRALATSVEPEAGKTAFYVDVPKTAWYFRSAHVARMYGVFKGSGNNDFHGADILTLGDAQTVVRRYGRAGLLLPEAQRDNPALPVLAKPSDVENLLQKDRLTSPEIAQAREQILALPPDMRGELFRRLASKSAYASQRDNAAKLAGTGDVMCNVTALAMVLQSLGIDNPDQRRQFEDVLDEMRATGKMGARTERSSRIPLAKKFGVSGKTVSYGAGRSAGAAKKWFEETVLPEMKQGAGVILSILMPPYGHIVRLQWVESEGLVVDDPYGRARGGNVSKYDANAKSGSTGAGAKGEDNHWNWQFVAEQANYVQFFVK